MAQAAILEKWVFTPKEKNRGKVKSFNKRVLNVFSA